MNISASVSKLQERSDPLLGRIGEPIQAGTLDPRLPAKKTQKALTQNLARVNSKASRPSFASDGQCRLWFGGCPLSHGFRVSGLGVRRVSSESWAAAPERQASCFGSGGVTSLKEKREIERKNPEKDPNPFPAVVLEWEPFVHELLIYVL